MPLLNVKLIEGVFTTAQKQEMIRKLTDTGSAGGLVGVARLQVDPTPKILSVVQVPNRHAVLTDLGIPNGDHTLQDSTNLNSGEFGTVGHITADATGRWQYDDNGAMNLPRRFSRLVNP